MAVAVRDLEATNERHAEAFGAEVRHRETVESDRVDEALVKAIDSHIQLTAATLRDEARVWPE